MISPNHMRMLIVEDEYFIANDLKRALDKEGAVVLGPVATEDDALVILGDMPVDCAVLDINLRGEMVYPLASKLRARGVPFLFVSGYEKVEPEAGFDDVDLLRKPFTTSDLIERMSRLAGGVASRPRESPPHD